jgi:hypothetical protein
MQWCVERERERESTGELEGAFERGDTAFISARAAVSYPLLLLPPLPLSAALPAPHSLISQLLGQNPCPPDIRLPAHTTACDCYGDKKRRIAFVIA